MRAILHNIRSVYNVASMFRTADGLGVEKLYLTGHTPAPIDRFGRKRDKFTKVALGAEDSISWKSKDDIQGVIASLQKEGMQVLACEPTENAVPLDDVSLAGEICLVFGHEVDGAPEAVIDACDKTIKIPMQGKKSSFNVAVAFSIITYAVIDYSG